MHGNFFLQKCYQACSLKFHLSSDVYLYSYCLSTIVWTHSHYCDVIMGAMASQITSLMIVYSTVHSGAYQRKRHSSASLAFVWGIHRWPVNKWPVTRKMFPFVDVIMYLFLWNNFCLFKQTVQLSSASTIDTSHLPIILFTAFVNVPSCVVTGSWNCGDGC